MFKKRFTFLFVPDSNGQSRQLSISLLGAYAVSISAVVLFLACLYFASAYFGSRVDNKELAALKVENSQLAQKFDDIQKKLSEADGRFQEIVEKEIALRNLFQLPEIDVEDRMLAVGGPDLALDDLVSDDELSIQSSEATVDRLLELSSFEVEKFEELEQELHVLKHRLDHTPCIAPAQGWFSRGFGIKFDPFTGGTQMHRGIDIAAKTGTPILAPAAGTIDTVGRESGLGNFIVINHGNGLMTRYGHLSAFKVKKGQLVGRGETIGYIGSTGRSTGPHLHYEVWKGGRAVNPLDFVLNRL